VKTRRSFVLAGLTAAAGCGRKRGDGYAGYAFVANEDGRAIAVVDLTAFAVIRHIPLNDSPSALIAGPDPKSLYALAPASGTLHELDVESLKPRRKLTVAAPALSMRLSPDSKSIWIASAGGRKLVQVELEQFRTGAEIALGDRPADFDLSTWFGRAVVSFGPARQIGIVDLAKRSVERIAADGDIGSVRFRSDGKAVLVADTTSRMLTVIEPASRRVMVHLPLSVRPDQFCFNRNGGQLFITGEGRDAVVVVYPYFAPEVAETVLAGSRPGAMAASAQHLFVANPSAGDVSILNIARRRMVAMTAVGAEPSHITITPDDEYALVLNKASGDMAVIRIAGLQPDRRKSAALFTMIPVGSKPVAAVVKAV
jgi:DNA-binding beta-propeller fold protein YncE